MSDAASLTRKKRAAGRQYCVPFSREFAVVDEGSWKNRPELDATVSVDEAAKGGNVFNAPVFRIYRSPASTSFCSARASLLEEVKM